MKKKLALLKKAAQANTLKKKIKKAPVKRVEPEDDEEIDSEFLEESQSKQIDFNVDESEENAKEQDNIDDRRLRLAKQILTEAKQKVRGDNFFAQEEVENDIGVQLEDEERKINQALQSQLLGKKNMIYTEIADNLSQEGQLKSEYYKGHTKCITAVQFDPLYKHLYTVSKDCSIIKWDAETKKKLFISLGKDENSHKQDILCASLNYDGKILATSGSDSTVKLWDTVSNTLISTLKSHRAPVYGVKFGLNSNNLCSVSCDRTLKLWDAGERAYIDTFFGHNTDINDIDASSADNFLTCGFDRQAIIWRTKFGSQLIFNGHDYSIDCIRSLTPEFFATGSQDGSISLWNTSKKKPIFQLEKAHNSKWVTALGASHNSDLLVSGSWDDNLNFYRLDTKSRKLTQFRNIPIKGIINGLVFSNNQQQLAVIQSDEHRLGRWFTSKVKNQIVVYHLW